MLIAAALSLVDVPEPWLQATLMRPLAPGTGALEGLWVPVAQAIPVGELGHRLDLLAMLWAFGCALAATWAGHQVFRGPGRWWAAVAAGPICALALTHWHHQVGAAVALDTLPVAFTATLAVTEVVRALVHFGQVPALARARALAAASATALLAPRAGIPLALLLVVGSLVSRRVPAGTPASRRPAVRAWLVEASVAIGPAAVAALALRSTGTIWSGIEVSSLHLSWPVHQPVAEHLPPIALHAGLALLVVLVVPLRWRGGPLLLGLGIAAVTIGDARGPLAPTPAAIIMLSTATAGWVWLAGSMHRRRGPWLAVAATPLAVGAVAAPLLGQLRPVTSAARRRPPISVLRIYEKGLIAPGDAVFVFGGWRRDIEEAQHVVGFRPDARFLDGHDLDELERTRLTLELDAQGRRLLSDSYDSDGSWPVTAVVDSGPLFWFVAELAPEDLEFTDLSRFEPALSDLPERDRARVARMMIERARFRRAIGAPEAALEALPLTPDRRQGLQTRLQLSRSARPAPGSGSELPPPIDCEDAPAQAWVTAEAADIMYAHGEHLRAAELFAEAAQLGHPEALAALARWQLRAGEESAAMQTIELLASEPELRPQAVQMLQWLAQRRRTRQAAELATALASVASSGDVAVWEAIARLQRIQAAAVEPPSSRAAIDRPVPVPARSARAALRRLSSSGRARSTDPPRDPRGPRSRRSSGPALRRCRARPVARA